MKQNLWRWVFVLYSVACVANIYGAENGNDNYYAETVSPEVPKRMHFADMDISFDRCDMYERMDRELISMLYSHTNTLLTIKRANRYFPIIIPILKQEGVPEDFVYLAAIESSFDNRALSLAKAGGIWQFMPATAKQLGLEVNEYVDERYDCEKATRAACKYLKQAYAKYGCWMTVASSYNAGMGRISKELDNQLENNSFDLYLNQETSRYLFRLLAIKLILENPKKYGFSIKPDQLYQPIGFSMKEVSEPVDNWVDWAKKQGISYAQLREMNPWIRDTTLPNKTGKTYLVRIPDQKDLYRSSRTLKIYNKNWIQK